MLWQQGKLSIRIRLASRDTQVSHRAQRPRACITTHWWQPRHQVEVETPDVNDQRYDGRYTGCKHDGEQRPNGHKRLQPEGVRSAQCS